jgi:hypothetical protein
VWEGNPLLVNLLKDKRGFRGVDAIPDEQVFRSAIINSSNDDFRAVWSRASGQQKDLTRAQLAKYIEERTFSNMGRNERADPVASANKLTQAISGINPQKLQMIFGKEKAAQLASLNKALIEIANPPAGSIPTGSAPAIQQLSRGIFSVLAKLAPGVAKGTPFLDVPTKQIESAMGARRQGQAIDRAINFIPRPTPQREPITNRLLQLALPAGYGAVVAQE